MSWLNVVLSNVILKALYMNDLVRAVRFLKRNAKLFFLLSSIPLRFLSLHLNFQHFLSSCTRFRKNRSAIKTW